jgi:hypothetical protein
VRIPACVRGEHPTLGRATSATTRCDACSMTSYLPGQKETICLILDFAVFRSAELSSQIAAFGFSPLRISYRVASMPYIIPDPKPRACSKQDIRLPTRLGAKRPRDS